jgi:ribonucleoside-diphosphate reductase alpha chain
MSNYLPTDYQSFIHTSRYARWLEKEGRRESWDETVGRYMDNVIEPVVDSGASEDNMEIAQQIEQAILGLEVMPSMRAMMTAGPAANRDNTCM